MAKDWKREYGIYPNKTVLVRITNPISGRKRNVNPKVARILKSLFK
jgi:hypothetical protein